MGDKMRPKKSGKSDYRTISLPNDLYEELFNFVKLHSNYVSVANFIRVAVRNQMDMENRFLQENYPTSNQLMVEIKEYIKREIKESKK